MKDVVRRLAVRHGGLVLAFLALFTSFRIATLRGWDEGFYFAQLTSTVGDGDLALQDDLLAFPNPMHLRLRALTLVLESGALHNTFSIGPAVLGAAFAWPWLVGGEPAMEGVRGALAVGSMVFTIVTVLATRAVVARWAPASAGLAAVLAVVAGPLALYGTRAHLGSHLPSAFCAALFLLGVVHWLEAGRGQDALLVGLGAGLLVISRWQDALIVVALLPALALSLADRPSRRRRALGLLAAGGAGALALALQALAWDAQFGSWLLIPQGSGYMDWTHPRVRALLLSPYHGLLPWMPVFALGLAAAAFLRPPVPGRVGSAFRLGVVLAGVLVVYASACVLDWWGGDSYGPRRLAALTPLAAIGLGGLLERLSWRGRVVAAAGVTAWAAFTVTAYLSGFDDLAVALGGAPSSDNPSPPGAYAGARWLDAGTAWPRILRPGFSFSDRPRMADRVVGLLASAAVFAAVVGAWRALARSTRLQRLAVHAVLAGVAASALWLAFRVPRNEPWNSTWRAVVRGIEPAPGDLPGSVEEAARLVLAAHALAEDDEARARALLARAPSAGGAEAIGELRSLVADPEYRRRLGDLRAGAIVMLP